MDQLDSLSRKKLRKVLCNVTLDASVTPEAFYWFPVLILRRWGAAKLYLHCGVDFWGTAYDLHAYVDETLLYVDGKWNDRIPVCFNCRRLMACTSTNGHTCTRRGRRDREPKTMGCGSCEEQSPSGLKLRSKPSTSSPQVKSAAIYSLASPCSLLINKRFGFVMLESRHPYAFHSGGNNPKMPNYLCQ